MELNTKKIVLSLFGLCLVIIFAVWRHGRRRMYELAKKIKLADNLKSIPILGHAHHLLWDTEESLNVFVKISEPLDLSHIWLLHKLWFFVSRPEQVKTVLNAQETLAKNDIYDHTHSMTGNGLLVLEVPRWKQHRRALMPAFGIKILNEYVEIFAKRAKLMVSNLLLKLESEIDIYHVVSDSGLSIVAEAAMGVNIDTEIESIELSNKITRIGDIIFVKICNFLYDFDFIYNLTPLSREEKKIAKEYHELTSKIITKRIEEFEQQKATNTIKESRKKFFMDIMLESQESGIEFTLQDIEDEVNTFMIAGSDTASTTLCFFFLCLAFNPEIQEKVYREVMDVIGNERLPTSEDLQKFEYMEKVIKETMRLFPVVPNVMRKVTSDFQIDEKHVLPEGSAILISIMAIHRHPEYYDDPMKFDPERFNPDMVAKRHPYTYIPFSGGPRNCIGIQFAYRAMKTFGATMIRNFRFETSYKSIEEVRLKQSVFLRPVLGYKLKLIARKTKS